MAGAVVSRTVTVKLHTLLLPLASVATEMTVLVPSENSDPDGGVETTVRFVSHASLAVTVKTPGVPPGPEHSRTRLLEQTICGRVVSRTVTVKLHTLLLPLASVATEMTVLVPSENSDPDGGVETTVKFVSQASLAVTVKMPGVPAGPAHSKTRLLEQVMAGAVVSRTVTVKLHTLLLPLASVATETTVLVPSENREPDGGLETMVRFVSQASLAVTEIGRASC